MENVLQLMTSGLIFVWIEKNMCDQICLGMEKLGKYKFYYFSLKYILVYAKWFDINLSISK